MQTINFTCGHCGNLMAVSTEWLGRQVRCPHCGQVVEAQAPGSSPPPPEEDSFSSTTDLGFHVPPPDEPESIFSAAESSDEVFSSPPPRIEVPVDAAWPSLDGPSQQQSPPMEFLTPTESPISDLSSPPPVENATPAHFFDSPLTPSSPDTVGQPFPEPDSGSSAFTSEAPLDSVAQLGPIPSAAAAAASRSQRSGLILALVIVPLISYSILATLAVIILRTQPEKPHPLEVLPDLDGDNPGATRKKKALTLLPKVPPDEQTVPAQLHVGLGQTLVVGDLEVTPQAVIERTITIQVGGAKADLVAEPCLALDLHLCNRSGDVSFAPLDRYFTRSWKRARPAGAPMPYTLLEMGDKRFYGGPAPWAPRGSGRFSEPVQVVEGQGLDRVLEPGEVMRTFICTDPEDGALKALDDFSGKLFWRVQLRRGLVQWRTLRGVEREDSAAAVIGVEFHSDDVTRANAAAPGL